MLLLIILSLSLLREGVVKQIHDILKKSQRFKIINFTNLQLN